MPRGLDTPSPAPIPSAQVTSVGQEPVLFSGSVRDNIAYGLKSCSDEKVMAAAQAANAHGFIQELEHGLNTGTFLQKRSWSCFLGVRVVSAISLPGAWLPLSCLPRHWEFSSCGSRLGDSPGVVVLPLLGQPREVSNRCPPLPS